MHAHRRLLIGLVAATSVAGLAHAEPVGDKPHGSIAPNLAPNLGTQVERPVAPVAQAAKPPVTLPLGAPSFELIDRGDTVEVIAHNIKASRTAVLPLRSRLQIPIAGAPVAKRVTPADRTVKLVELDSEDATRVLSVKLGFEYPETKLVSRYAQAIQIGDDLHLLVPRAVPVDGVAPKLPEPTLSASAAAAMAKADHTAMLGPAPDPNAPPPKPKPPAPVEVVPGIKPELRPAAGAIAPTASAPAPPAPVPPAPDKPVEPVEKILGPAPDPHARPITKPAPADKLVEPEAACERPSDKPGDKLADHEPDTDKPAEPHATRPRTDHLGRVLAPPVDDLWSKIALYAVLGLGAAGVGVWMLKRRRLNIPPNVEIAILAQRSLGGRARVVWLGAGDHELLIAVTPQAVNVLGQWPRGAASAAAAAPVPAPGDDSFAGQMSYAMGPMSMYAAAAAPSQPVPVQVPPPAAPRRRATSQAAPAEPPARAVTTEYFDEAGDYDEHAAEGPPVSREPRPSRPAIVLPPVPAAIAAEARLRRDSQFQRPVTQPVTQPEPADADKPVSPAVNGILKLRGRTSQAPVVEPAREADADADDAAEVELIDDGGAKPGAAIDREADQAWIKDILAAGGGAP